MGSGFTWVLWGCLLDGRPWPLEHPQSICSVLSGLHLRVALSGCIDVSAIRLLRPPRHACFATLRTLHLN